jgi:Txe/YoeB family toxin of toxin-antitoxin system
VTWKVVYAKQAVKDARKLAAAGLKPKAEALLLVLARDPFERPPPFEKLVGDLAGAYSRRINIQHRLVYEVFPESHTVRVLRMWTHYE